VLGQAIGPEAAALTAVLSRLLMTLVDVALAGLGALLPRLERGNQPQGAKQGREEENLEGDYTD